MAKNIQYITQLTAEDISKMLDAGNLTVGKGIRMDRDVNGLRLSVDVNYIVAIIWSYINCGFATTVNSVDQLTAITRFNGTNL